MALKALPQIGVIAAIAVLGMKSTLESKAEGICDASHFKVAIDVGHTPEAHRALSARGVPEYTFNYALGMEILGTLAGAGYPTVLTTVHGRGLNQLLKRTSQARAQNALLFLSIHHDDVQPIYKAKWRYNGKLQSYSDRFSGYSLFVSSKNADYSGSLAFARLLGRQLTSGGMTSPLTIQRISRARDDPC
ncbi:MAG: hypothetical protein NVSMB58_35740 [Terriglobales bacterium]